MANTARKIRAVIVDFDGTILDSVPGVVLANQRAAAAHGLRVPMKQEILSLLTRGMVYHEIVRNLWPQATDADLLALRQKTYAEARDMKFKEVHGAREALCALRKLEMTLALHTNRTQDENLVHDLLKAGFREDDFRVIHTPENGVPPKPDQRSLRMLIDFLSKANCLSSAEHACVVSDSVQDAEMALACGCRFIGVRTGAATDDDFMPLRGDIIVVPSIANVPDIISAL